MSWRGKVVLVSALCLVSVAALFFIHLGPPATQAQVEQVRAKLISVLRPAPAGQGGPWFVTTEKDGTIQKVTTGLATPVAALNQARDDQGALLNAGGLVPQRIAISTDAATAP